MNRSEYFSKRHEIIDKYRVLRDYDSKVKESKIVPNLKEAKALLKQKLYDQSFIKCQEVSLELQMFRTFDIYNSINANYYMHYSNIYRNQNTFNTKRQYLYNRMMASIHGILGNLDFYADWGLSSYFTRLESILPDIFKIEYRNVNYFELYLKELNRFDHLDDIKQDISNFMNNTILERLNIDKSQQHELTVDGNYELKIAYISYLLIDDWSWLNPYISSFVNDIELKYLN